MSMISLGFLRPSMLHQNFPGTPTFTEKDIPDLAGKVYIVTGSNSGVGKELARILYSANATVYVACRTESKAQKAIEEIHSASPQSNGTVKFLHLDLSDLTTIKPAAEAFMRQEEKLHVLFNNAGVMTPPDGEVTAQGYDLQLGTNCLGPFLFTQLLTPTLANTATDEAVGAVRVVWVSSMAAELYSVHHGLDVGELKEKNYPSRSKSITRYGNSKAGNYYHSVEYARRHREDGIISVAMNPGNLDSELYRSSNTQKGLDKITINLFTKIMLYPQVNGAYTELFSGFSPDITAANSGCWVGPWGRFFNIRKDIAAGTQRPTEGGQSISEQFWEWSVEQTRNYR
ncbi:short-chain alcohol dehydrogenase [Conoideocrella luteorostrata]|uniref:Short-chain alcohol dehydrogenase n=1 Tax=Conoideocrella luteorostrata TaxID=1105319 RepID=A0AAJ0CIG0_9HYPO|nr:short-chain alcohol dehydrogenase [Conoideocrella luteorostrata]